MPMTARDGLVAIAGLLAPDQPEVARRVAAAHDDPAGYLKQHPGTAPVRLLPWLALVEALHEHGLVAEVDRREKPDEVVRQLRALRSSPPDAWEWAADTEFHARTDEFLRITAEHLRPVGVGLSALDIDADYYPLVLAPAARTTELNNLAKLAGHRVYQFVAES
ncbi:MAG TPA: hypothetical protein VJX10_11125 [Pseudonocardiaceae bacterium]|nr:hypothetical protein [Pseudonocardiaceae bacterium]